jgi:hypothetical protein
MRRWLSWAIGSTRVLGAIALLCLPNPALAGPLAERVQRFPQWTEPPPTQAAQEDLVYPDWFKGTWIVTSQLEALEAPLAPAIVTPGFEQNRQWLQRPVQFQVRFRPEFRPLGNLPPLATGQIVPDRAFNGLSIARAYLGDIVEREEVKPHNPNEQLTLLKGDRQLVSRISRRATETVSPEEFIATELVQQIFRAAANPYLNTVESTTDYLRQADGSLVGEQLTAVYLSPQDPDYFKAAARPIALYRYHLQLSPVTPFTGPRS